MSDQRQNLYRAFSILNTLLIPVFVLFLIDILNLSFLSKFGLIFIILIVAPLKIYFMSAIGGSILEIISGEEYALRIERVDQNAKDLWQGFLTAFVIVFLVDFLLFVPFPAFRAWRPVFLSLLGLIATYVLARWAINKKYVTPFGIPHRKFNFRSGFLPVIITAFLLELILVRFSGHFHIGDFHGRNIFAFIFNYIHVFEFILCSLYVLDAYPEVNERFSRQKEIFLINPMGEGVAQSLAFWVYWVLVQSYPPFFVVLKALSPKTYKFREFNWELWHERYYKGDVLVCITCFTSNCCEAYKIAKEFKKRGSKVVMGGPHVTYLSEEALAFCDSVVIGQAEGVWKDVVRDYENGTLRPRYKGAATEADHSQVHEELLNSPPSIIKEFLETTRGCKFHCHFCTIPALSGGELRTVSINSFVELIKKVKGHHNNVIFIDNNIYSDPGYARELFIALKPLKIKWQSMCTIDIAKNRETLKLARESGCFQLLVGYEVSSGSLEKNQGGKFAMAQKYKEYTDIIKKAGIDIDARFIFGFDSDNMMTLFSLWGFAFSIMPKFTVVSMLTPLPGSGLYQDMLTQDRIINLNWRRYTATKIVIRHPRLNYTLMSFLFPLIQALFLMTTSIYGLMILIIILCFISIAASHTLFR